MILFFLSSLLHFSEYDVKFLMLMTIFSLLKWDNKKATLWVMWAKERKREVPKLIYDWAEKEKSKMK